jgi:hypothetical protein
MNFSGAQMEAALQTRPVASASAPNRLRRTPQQPLSVIEVDGALLRLETVSAISGRSFASLHRDEKAGLLKMTRNGARCTRVRSEDARAYLHALARGAA